MANKIEHGRKETAGKKKSDRDRHRGRRADRPREIPRAGWRDIALRVKNEQKQDNLSIVAAGVAFYSLLAIFPAIAAAISIYGLVADPATVQQQIESLAQILPQQAQQLLSQQISSIAQGAGGALSAGLIGGILLTIWSAAKGMKALITSLNITYDEEEKRGFLKLNGMALLLTLGAILFGLVALTLIVVLPALLGNIGLPSGLRGWISALRWPLLALAVMAGLTILYRFAPSRDNPQWRWVSWGAVGATLLWLGASALFSWYVSNFGDYNKTYGSLGAVIILLMWFFITAYAVLLGAEVNSEMEHQTRRDTTRGEERPMGERDAHAADTLGKKP